MKELEELLYKYLDKGLVQLIISNPRTQAEAVKISLRPVLLKGKLIFQASAQLDKKIFHYNFDKQEAVEAVLKWMDSYRQLEIFSEMGQATVLISKKGKITIKEKKSTICVKNGDFIITMMNQTEMEELKKDIVDFQA